MMLKHLKKMIFTIGAGLVLASSATAATVGDFEIDFLGVDYNADGTSTWTYKVASDTDTSTMALSHWALELCEDVQIIEPAEGEGTYTTLASFDGFTGRADITYDVVYDLDPTTGIDGIKFENATNALGEEDNLGEDGVMEMDIFQFTLDQHYAVDTNGVGVVAGPGSDLGMIDGPSLDCHLVPVPAASWMGLSLLAGLGVVRKWQMGRVG